MYFRWLVVLSFILAFVRPVWAGSVAIEESVENWRILYRPGGINSFGGPEYQVFSTVGISVSGVGTVCSGGALGLPFNFTYDDWKMFYSVYLVAKTGSIKMRVVYDDASGRCDVVRFGLAAAQ